MVRYVLRACGKICAVGLHVVRYVLWACGKVRAEGLW